MIYAFFFSMLCFLLSCAGASTIFFVKNLSAKLEAFLHAFAGGVMIASSIFSLLIPAIEYCDELSLKAYIILPVCFLLAYVAILILDIACRNKKDSKINTFTLNLGIALHNIPEGMCVGFAFASASLLGTETAFLQAVMVSVGIGIQNFPEGSSVSFPLFSIGYKKSKAFLISALVAFVEVPAGIIAYLIGLNYVFLLPYMLTFSAGIMICVSVCDLLPESISKNKRLAQISFFVGFVFMMLLDLALG